MIIQSYKPVIGIEKFIKPLVYYNKRSNQEWLVLYKGYQPHYQWLNNHHTQIHQKTLIYAVDICRVNITLQMALMKRQKIMFISPRNYQNVEAVPNSKFINNKEKAEDIFVNNGNKGLMLQKKGQQIESMKITQDISKRAKYILDNYDFKIRETFLDIHPLEAYQKMCGYLLEKPEKEVLALFSSFSCTQHLIFNDFVLYPLLNEMRTRFLMTDSFKLKTLNRRHPLPPSQLEKKAFLDRWKETINYQLLKTSNSSTFNESQLIEWSIQNKLAQSIQKQQLLDGLYRNYNYGSML